MTLLSVPRLAAFLATLLAAAALSAYAFGIAGLPIDSPIVWPLALAVAILMAGALPAASAAGELPLAAWAGATLVCVVLLLLPALPAMVPPGGASDLTHHLMLADVLARTRHLVDGAASEPALGEMAHYTPGVHLVIVLLASFFGVEGSRAAYPLLAGTIALKAGFVFLITFDLLRGKANRAVLAAVSVPLILLAPPAYSVDGFLQAGFVAQVAAELFVVAGWWALARWWIDPRLAWMILTGVMAAAVFIVWPIWIGPLMVAIALAVALRRDVPWRVRGGCAAAAVLPAVIAAAVHLVQHAAWLRLAGTSGAVPAFRPNPTTWLLLTLASTGVWAIRVRPAARTAIFFAGGLALQALALWSLAEWRGAETPYMAMKMIYLAIYPLAVFAAVGLAEIVSWAPAYQRAAAFIALVAIGALGAGVVTAHPVPPPIVNLDLEAAGRWARVHLPPACVDYVANDAEQAYWLHLAVMGEPRASSRTADLDGYTANRAVGRLLEGVALPYAVALHELLPGELLREAQVLARFGSAVVIGQANPRCPPAPHP